MLLLFLIIIPLISGLICCFFEYLKIKISQWLALLTIILLFILSILLWYNFFYCIPIGVHNAWNLEYVASWIPNLGIELHLSIDKLSLMMILLSIFFSFVSILCSWNNIQKNQGYFYFNLLLILFGTIGSLLSCDLFLFFCFWEIMLFPIYFLIIFWGNKKYTYKQRVYTANKFLIYTQISSLIMLFSILCLSLAYYQEMHDWTFNYNLLVNLFLPLPLELFIMLGFFIAFIVKMPIFPFQNWLPDVHSKLPNDSSIDLIGMLVKMGVYGLLRFNMHLFPFSSYFFSSFAIFLGIITIFYSALMAFIEINVKKILAYMSISHMGLILIAIYCGNYSAYQGAIIQIFSSSLSIGALFVLFSQIYLRYQTNNIVKMGGLFLYIKWIPSFILFFTLINLNFPGTLNFISEIMILVGVFHIKKYIAYLLIFSLLLSVIYSFNMIHKVLYGPINKNLIQCVQMSYREFIINVFFIFLILTLSIFPKIILYIL